MCLNYTDNPFPFFLRCNGLCMSKTNTQSIGIILLLAFLAAIGPLAIDTYLPSLPAIAADFGSNSGAAQQSVTAFFIGIAAGQLVAGPLSDRFGRRPVLLIGFGLFFITCIACALAPNIETLIFARLLQGLSAAVSPSAGRAMVRDIWEGNEAARAMSYITMAMVVAPLLAPMIGGVIMTYWGWRFIFWFLLAFSALALALVLIRLPETNGPEKRGNVRLPDYFRAYGKVLSQQQSWAYLLCGGFSLATMFAYITGSPFVYIEFFGVKEAYFGFFFALNVVGLFLGNFINARLVDRFGYINMLMAGVTTALIGAIMLLFTSYFAIGGIVAVVVGLFIAVAPASMVGSNSTVGLMNNFPRNAGAAMGVFGVAQFGLGALASFLVGALYTGTPMAMALGMAITALFSFLAMLWLMALQGKNQA